MIYFQCDYAEGCHPDILHRMSQTNMAQSVGYGMDEYCESARRRIRAACEREDVAVHFLVGGTQANATVITSILRPHQGVLTAQEGHIACHESGAIEARGHKAITLPCQEGKITAAQVEEAYQNHWNDEAHEHVVQPAMVYLSFPTESGTLYTKAELTAISQVCKKRGLYLFLDGARLGYGLTSPANDLTLSDLARLCDVFYIGGTKCGALFGEAVVIANPALDRDFRYIMKQMGGMLAKGRLLGLQFDTLFTDDLYFTICRKANDLAMEIRRIFEEKGLPIFGSSPTNQQFVELTDSQRDYLAKEFAFETWGPGGCGRKVYRFCASWATQPENVEKLRQAVAQMDC